MAHCDGCPIKATTVDRHTPVLGDGDPGEGPFCETGLFQAAHFHGNSYPDCQDCRPERGGNVGNRVSSIWSENMANAIALWDIETSSRSGR